MKPNIIINQAFALKYELTLQQAGLLDYLIAAVNSSFDTSTICGKTYARIRRHDVREALPWVGLGRSEGVNRDALAFLHLQSKRLISRKLLDSGHDYIHIPFEVADEWLDSLGIDPSRP